MNSIADIVIDKFHKAIEHYVSVEEIIDFQRNRKVHYNVVIIDYDEIFHETVLAVIEKRTFRNLISFLNFENIKGIRKLCAECINEMKKYIKEYVMVGV